MYDNSEKCPVCGSGLYSTISVHSPDGYANLILSDHGGTYLNVCLNCGAVYLNKFKLNQIQKKLKGKKK